MGTIIAVVVILALIGTVVALAIRQVLRAPMAPSPQPTPLQTSPLAESGVTLEALQDFNLHEAISEITEQILLARGEGQQVDLGTAIEKGARLAGLSFFFAFGPERKAPATELPHMAKQWWFNLTELLVRVLQARPVHIDKSRVGISPNIAQPSRKEVEQMLALAQGPWMDLIRRRRLSHEQASLACVSACARIIDSVKEEVDPHQLCCVACKGFMEGTRLAQAYWASRLHSSGKSGDSSPIVPSEAVKVGVFLSGRIEVDGKSVSISELDERLGVARAANKMVLYYREPPNGPQEQSDLPAHIKQILELVMKHRLAIAFAKTPDFSDTFTLDEIA